MSSLQNDSSVYHKLVYIVIDNFLALDYHTMPHISHQVKFNTKVG